MCLFCLRLDMVGVGCSYKCRCNGLIKVLHPESKQELWTMLWLELGFLVFAVGSISCQSKLHTVEALPQIGDLKSWH